MRSRSAGFGMTDRTLPAMLSDTLASTARAHDAVIRVYDDAGKVIEAHEHAGDFKEP
jgi:hypothetical protein